MIVAFLFSFISFIDFTNMEANNIENYAFSLVYALLGSVIGFISAKLSENLEKRL